MQMQLQSSIWTCLPAAFGMVLDLSEREMFDLIGHDGSEIVWPDLKDPLRRRGFNVQECIEACLLHLTYPVKLDAVVVTDGEPHSLEIEMKLGLKHYLPLVNGVLIVHKKDYFHAVAWDKSMCFDPTGFKAPLSDYEIETFYACF